MFQNYQIALTGFLVFSDHLSIFWGLGSCWGLYLLRLAYWYFCEIETKGKNKSVGISKCVWTPIGSVCTEAAGEETADSPPSCSKNCRKWAERRKPRNRRKQVRTGFVQEAGASEVNAGVWEKKWKAECQVSTERAGEEHDLNQNGCKGTLL